MNFRDKRILGRTGLQVARIGISSSFGAPAEAYEEAFDRGCNYFTWGTFVKGRSSELKRFLRKIVQNGQREKIVLSMFTYAHNTYLTKSFLIRGLKALGIEYADILILGYFPKLPPQRVIDGALELKENGLVRWLGISSHNRTLFPELERGGLFDVFHIRYNAAHRGAEIEAFPYLTGSDRPGVVSFTATSWKQLLKTRKIPKYESPPTPMDCYRFVLSNPAVDVCMMGAKNIEQMKDNLTVLDQGPMNAEELNRMRKIGDVLHRKKIFKIHRN